MKVDRHRDQLNNQLTDMMCRQVPCSKVTTNNCHYLQNDSLPISPVMVDECLFFGFMSSKRITNTRYSLLEDKSRIICFTNLREEGFVPKKGLSMFNLTSPLKENSASFLFRESE